MRCIWQFPDSLRWTSALSVALAVVFVVIVVGVTLWKLVTGGISMPRLTPDVYDQKSFWHLFTVIPVMVTAYICHHNGNFYASRVLFTKLQFHYFRIKFFTSSQ
jgi:sodium-coupled neutral amino acid transporter 2